MANQYNNLQYPQVQNSQQYNFFPQPQGIMYTINNSSELNNIPLNSSTIIAICFSEGLCHIRTLQNGTPIISSYKITPYVNEEKSIDKNLMELIKDIDTRLKNLENSKKGGTLDEFL